MCCLAFSVLKTNDGCLYGHAENGLLHARAVASQGVYAASSAAAHHAANARAIAGGLPVQVQLAAVASAAICVPSARAGAMRADQRPVLPQPHRHRGPARHLRLPHLLLPAQRQLSHARSGARGRPAHWRGYLPPGALRTGPPAWGTAGTAWAAWAAWTAGAVICAININWFILEHSCTRTRMWAQCGTCTPFFVSGAT